MQTEIDDTPLQKCNHTGKRTTFVPFVHQFVLYSNYNCLYLEIYTDFKSVTDCGINGYILILGARGYLLGRNSRALD